MSGSHGIHLIKEFAFSFKRFSGFFFHSGYQPDIVSHISLLSFIEILPVV